MRSLYDILTEAKDDNLHEFIQYLKDCGEEGELRGNCNKDHLYSKYMLDCNIQESPYFGELTDTDNITLEEYVYENDIDIDEIEWTDDFIQEFTEWCVDKATDTVLEFIKTNNKNCIYIERAIVVPTFTNKDKLYKLFKIDYDGHLGVCWAYKKDCAEAYYGGFEKGDTIILKGYVRPEDVNWTETLALCLCNEDEYELRLNDSAPIQLTEIVTERGNHKIFTGNLILQALPYYYNFKYKFKNEGNWT